jgi:hypothetical protein
MNNDILIENIKEGMKNKQNDLIAEFISLHKKQNSLSIIVLYFFTYLIKPYKEGEYVESQERIPTHLVLDFLIYFFSIPEVKNFEQANEPNKFIDLSNELVQSFIDYLHFENITELSRDNRFNLLFFPRTTYPEHLKELVQSLYLSETKSFEAKYKFNISDFIILVDELYALEVNLSNNAEKIISGEINAEWWELGSNKMNKNLLKYLSTKTKIQKIEDIKWDNFLELCILESKAIFEYENSFYLLNPNKLLYEGTKILYELIKNDKDVRPKVANNFEDFVTNIFQQILPGAVIYQSCEYKDRETDIIILYGGVLFIIECKNGLVTNGLKTGDWYKNDKKGKFFQQIEKPYQQAQSCKDYIFSKSNATFKSESGNHKGKFHINTDNISQTFLISVTSDYWGNLAAYPEKIKEYGEIYFTERYWSVCVQDLLIIRDLVESPSIFIFYLQRRLEWMRWTKMISSSDEIDLFEHFLDTGLLITKDDKIFKEYDKVTEIMHDIPSDKIDSYYRTNSPKELKPKLKADPNFKEFIKKVEETNSQDFFKLTSLLYQAGGDLHEQLSSWILEKVDLVSDSASKYILGCFSLDIATSLDFKEKIQLNLIILIVRNDFTHTTDKMLELKKYQQKIGSCFGIIIKASKDKNYVISSIQKFDYNYSYNPVLEKILDAKK